MMKYFLFSFILFITVQSSAQVLRKRSVTLMGSRFDISIVAKDSASAEENIDEIITEVTRIENLISDWRAYTQIGQVNNNAGIKPIKVDREVFELTERAIELSKITDGAFDISFAAMDRIWKFDGSMTMLPSTEAIQKSIEKVGYKNIILDREKSTIFLKFAGMKIGFGALGEGYAADKCKKMMLAKGITAGIVNGSGDMNTWGKQPDGNAWNIGVSDPKNPTELLAIVPLQHGAVVTSGSYEKFVLFNGKRYAHIINPKTGYPATGLTSVTIFGPSAELANGLSTSIMVMGKKAGLKLLKHYPEMSCILISDKGKLYSSPSLKLSKYRVRD